MNKKKLLASVANILVLCTVIFFVSMSFVYDEKLIGYVLVILGFLCLATLKLFKMSIRSVGPDIIFGIIDNGALAAMALFGGKIAGVSGAIIGGVVGNAITDGIAGLFEGYWAESFVSEKRTVLGSAVGKMAGCLFGAGVVMVIASFF